MLPIAKSHFSSVFSFFVHRKKTLSLNYLPVKGGSKSLGNLYRLGWKQRNAHSILNEQ